MLPLLGPSNISALFHEDAVEDIHGLEPMESGQMDTQRSNRESHSKLLESKTRPTKLTQKPAAHRLLSLGFHGTC